jgi:MFS family permease
LQTQGEFNWDEMEQSIILSSFFWGYLIFQVPGGRIAEVLGAKRVFGGAVLINGTLSLVLPFLARTHWILLLVIRTLQGLAQVCHKYETVILPG